MLVLELDQGPAISQVWRLSDELRAYCKDRCRSFGSIGRYFISGVNSGYTSFICLRSQRNFTSRRHVPVSDTDKDLPQSMAETHNLAWLPVTFLVFSVSTG